MRTLAPHQRRVMRRHPAKLMSTSETRKRNARNSAWLAAAASRSIAARQAREPAPAPPPPYDSVDDERVFTVLAAPSSETPAIRPALYELSEKLNALCAPPPLFHAMDAIEDIDPPFDPPDEEDIFGDDGETLTLENTQALDSPPSDSEEDPFPQRGDARRRAERSAPAITIHASWDRPATAEIFASLAADARMARTEITFDRGGIDGAAMRFATRASPDLLILDTTLAAAQMIASLDRLGAVIAADAKIMIIGAVNDIPLLRELRQRGICQYVLAPAGRDDLIAAICKLYADTDKSRVVAVIGARGGVGASTVAHNIAWSIAERQGARTTLVDLDLAFGGAAFEPIHVGAQSIADALLAPHGIDDALLERATVMATPRLHVLAAPAALHDPLDLDVDAVGTLIGEVRRTAAFVVLDLPHRWNAWVKATLLSADAVVIVAAPDLASMRNTKNMLDQLTSARRDCDPLVALSMTGTPKRPEISVKDFADAIGAEPAAVIAFDAELFGLSAMKGKPIGDIAPLSKTARLFDTLASSLTGRSPSEVRRPADPAPPPVRDAVFAARLDEIEAHQTGPRPFTFAPPRADVVDLPEEPLELTERAAPTSAISLAQAREAALAQLPRVKSRRRGRPGTLRTAFAVAALALAGVWFAQNRGEATAVAPSPRPTAPSSLDTQYQSALQLIRAGQAQQGVALLHSVAASGLPEAQYDLAKRYETGEGVRADLAAARHWTERAAGAGHSQAMHDLGVYFMHGEGGAQDEAAAFRWFRQAAEFNVADSQYNLGILYQSGRGVSADAQEALFWFLVAARNGDSAAVGRVADLEAQLTPMEIEQARGRAEAFRTASAPV
jgi:pilus assembly protein CpaE